MTSGKQSKRRRREATQANNIPQAQPSVQNAQQLAPNRPPDHQTEFTVTAISGPLPAPDILTGYGHVNPTFPERIVTMAENQQAHRHQCERTALDSEIKARTRGQAGLVLICALAIIVTPIIAIWGNEYVAGLIGAGGLASVLVTAITRAAGFPGHPPKTGEGKEE